MEILILLIVLFIAIVAFQGKGRVARKRNKEEASFHFSAAPVLSFNTDANPEDEIVGEILEFLEKPYKPRTGKVEIELYSQISKLFKLGEHLEIVFRTKDAYAQSSFWEVAFRYGEELIAIESQYYQDQHPLIRVIRANFSGYQMVSKIEHIEGAFLKVGVQFVKDGQVIDKRVVRAKSTKTTGKFDVVGFHFLPGEVKTIVWKELKEGDLLQLVPDPENHVDKKAIKVLFKDHQIGWVPKDHQRKDFLFESLMANKEIQTTCFSNYRQGEYGRVKKDGKWQDEYKGMTQYVTAKFTADKE